jgi:hypothetical protein
MNTHRTHTQIEKRMNKRAEAALDYLTALVIAAGLTYVLIKWWTS